MDRVSVKFVRVNAALALFGALFVNAAFAAPVWITVGDAALAELRDVAPAAQVMGSRQVKVMVPAQQGSSRLISSTEGVHAVEVDESALPALSDRIHGTLRRCGGFIQHPSMADALATVNRIESMPKALAAPDYAIGNQTLVTTLLPQMQASNILTTIDQLSAFQNRHFQSTSGVAASAWLYNYWVQFQQSTGARMRVTQISHPGFPQKSVLLDFPGTETGDMVVLGAHLDSIAPLWFGAAEVVRAPGADDDASGVAGLTEVIRVLVANNFRPKRTLRFIAYAAEEAGLQGSRDIAARSADQRARVVGVLQLDMTAYQGETTDLWLITDYTSAAQNAFLASLAATYLPQLTVGYTACGYACSDHASWTQAGYPASFPFESSFAKDNKAIHTPSDTITTFGGQADHALKFAKLALAFAVEMGNSTALPREAQTQALSSTAKRR